MMDAESKRRSNFGFSRARTRALRYGLMARPPSRPDELRARLYRPLSIVFVCFFFFTCFWRRSKVRHSDCTSFLFLQRRCAFFEQFPRPKWTKGRTCTHFICMRHYIGILRQTHTHMKISQTCMMWIRFNVFFLRFKVYVGDKTWTENKYQFSIVILYWRS